MAPLAPEKEITWNIPAITDAEFTRFQRLIRERTGIHLSDLKRHLLVTRLAQTLKRLGLTTFQEYYAHVIADRSGNELHTLINRITTNKTSFFREPHHFAFLKTQVIPQARLRNQKALRIWSAGCSSGEEPYSIAIAVLEALGKHHGWDVHILASDIDTDILEQAKSGTYSMEALDEVSEERRHAYFLRGYGEYTGLAQVRPEVRRMIEFRQVNLSERAWGLPAHFDVIFCRNVIIYFDRSMQQQIVGDLAGHLKPTGVFFSGHSENLFWLRDLLVPVEPTVYRLRQAAGGR